MHEELSVAIELAERAGEAILGLRHLAHRVEHKPDGDPVTAADRAADALIRGGLEAAFPGDAILSEETPDDVARLDVRRLWLVDPLDGTRHFIRGRDEFAVMIGLAIDGAAVAGVVHLPAEGVTWAGAPGHGARRIDGSGTRPVTLAEVPPGARSPVIAASRSPPGSRVHRVAERLGGERVVYSGSVGRKSALVLGDLADAYLTLGTRSRHWDACAPDAIVRAAGGSFTTASGTAIEYNVPETRNLGGLLACRSGIAGRVVETVRAVVADDGRQAR